MTERLYYGDSLLAEFDATVVEASSDGLRLYLDRTAFYPASGGQPFDLGTINDAAVVDVIDEGERIAHVLASPVAASSVHCRIDMARRRDHMQQHTPASAFRRVCRNARHSDRQLSHGRGVVNHRPERLVT